MLVATPARHAITAPHRVPAPSVSHALAANIESAPACLHFHEDVFPVRDGATPLARLPGTRRILMLGDSYLFGAGVRAAEALPAALERELNLCAPQCVWEALNLARRGASLTDQLGHLRRFLDCAGPGYTAEHVLILVNYTDAELQPLRLHFPDDPGYLAATWNPDADQMRFLIDCVSQARSVCRARGANVTLLHFDHLRLPISPRALQVLRKIALAADVALSDLTPAFANCAPDALRVSAPDEHPNPLALRLAATAIARDLFDQNTAASSADAVAQWRLAVGQLPPTVAAARYRARLARSRSEMDAARSSLRIALHREALPAAARFQAETLARLRPFDGRLEFALHQLELQLASMCDGGRSASLIVKPRWGNSGSALATKPPEELLQEVLQLVAATAKADPANHPVVELMSGLDLLSSLLAQWQRLDGRWKRLATSVRGRNIDLLRDAETGLLLAGSAIAAICGELRLAALAEFLRTPVDAALVTLHLHLRTESPAPCSILANWQPVAPLRPLVREGCTIDSSQPTWEVGLELPFVGEAQLSLGGDLSSVACEVIRINCGPREIDLEPAEVFRPHRRWRIIPALGLIEPVAIPASSPAWEALAAAWPDVT